MLADRCKKCGSSQFLDLDEQHGFYARKCIGGHLNGYLDSRGVETPLRTMNLPRPERTSGHYRTPVSSRLRHA